MEEEKIEFKVTEKNIEEAIVHEIYQHLGAKTVICLLVLNTGYEVVGSSAPVDVANFDLVKGKELAREKAIDGVWGHLGSIVQWRKAVYESEKLRKEAITKQEEQGHTTPQSENHEVPVGEREEIIEDAEVIPNKGY